MKIGTFSEMEFVIPAGELLSLRFRAKQGEIMFAENKANQEKIKRLKKEVGDLMAKVENQRKEVREMSVKWSKAKKPAGKEQQADDSKKPADGKKPSKGKKEAK